MSKFNPALLMPVQAQGSTSNARSVKDVALDNIQKMKHLFQHPEDDGKRNFKKVDDKTTSFTIRVSNTALVLGQFDQGGVKSCVREMTVPTVNFLDAMDYFADKVKAGEFDAQLEALNAKKAARTEKLKKTRSEKKAERPKA